MSFDDKLQLKKKLVNVGGDKKQKQKYMSENDQSGREDNSDKKKPKIKKKRTKKKKIETLLKNEMVKKTD